MSGPERIVMLDLQAQNGPLQPELRAAFERVMAHGQFVLGPEVEAFEQLLCDRFGFTHALGTSSGTDALLLALMTLGIGPGDEVVTTPFSFFATAGCVARLGARPVFVDIDPATFNLEPAGLEAAITSRTRAIVPVHLFGRLAAMDAIGEVAARHGVPLIEDAAQALGAGGARPAGSLGDMGCFSFFPSKNLGGFGDGGLLVLRDAEAFERARVLRAHGAEPKYHHALVGGNFRLDALQAALLSVKVPRLEGWAVRRRAHAEAYAAAFEQAGLEGRLTWPEVVDGHVFNQFVVRCERRDALRESLSARGIETAVYYPRPLHLQPCFAQLGYVEGAMPEAERACREVLALPLYPELPEAQRERVARAVVEALRSS